MDYDQRVLWGEGMLLTPQHFQQSDRYHAAQSRSRHRAVRSLDWGFCSLALDTDAIGGGEVVVKRVSGVLPNGLWIDAPESDRLPAPRKVDVIAFPPEQESLLVYIGMPMASPGQMICQDGANANGTTAYMSAVAKVKDETDPSEQREIQVQRKQLKLAFEGEGLDTLSRLPIARLRRAPTGSFELDPGFIPPVQYIEASSRLMEILRGILERAAQKSEDLAGQFGQREQGVLELTASEAARFAFLQTVNTHVPVLTHFFNLKTLHPEELYREFLHMAGRLYSLTSADSQAGTVRELPPYLHDTPSKTFNPLGEKINLLLETVLPTRCVPIPLQKVGDSIWQGRIADERLFDSAVLYLSVAAEVGAEKVALEIPIKAKTTSGDRMSQIIAAAIMGIRLRHLPAPPSDIPVQPGRTYFQVNQEGDHWEAVKKSKTISFFIPPEFTGARLELMGVWE